MLHPPGRKKGRRKKQIVGCAVLGMALLAAIVFALCALQLAEKAPAAVEPQETAGSRMRALALYEAQELKSVTVDPAGGESYTLQVVDGKLYLDADGVLEPVRESYADALLGAITRIVSQETVVQNAAEVEEHLAEMGLDPAQARAVITLADGREEVLEVGVQVPNTAFWYFRWSGDKGVHMCDEEVREALNFTENRLSDVARLEIDPSRIDEVIIRNAQGEMRLRFGREAYGELEEPFVYPLGAEAAQSLLSALEQFRLGTREALLTETNTAEYGFDHPLCVVELHQNAGSTSSIDGSGGLVVKQEEERSIQFVIGREEGAFFYTCAYEDQCYLVSRFLAEALVKTSADALLTRNPANMGDLPLESICIDAPDGTIEVQIVRTESVLPNNELETDEQGNVVYTTKLLLNGKEAAQETIDELGSRLAMMNASGKLPDGWTVPQEQPRWRIEMKSESGVVRVMEGYRLDLFTDVVVVNGMARHTMDSEQIELVTEGMIP